MDKLQRNRGLFLTVVAITRELMRRRLLIFAVAICMPALLQAQGFNSTNGRNHPELRWQVAETEHFKIMYPQRLSGIENQAAPIAEASYQALSENLAVTFQDKIRIYLSDEDEITNGFAVPIGAGYTDIWVHVNDYAETFTGNEKWLRKVLAHELAHIFHYRAVKSKIGFWQFLLGDPLPRFWTEGLAQYQTEAWDSQRGDRWLRLAVFDDKMDYAENDSGINRRLVYATGNSQLRYFSEIYGDSALADLFQHRSHFLGLPYHDFYKAFSEVTGDSYSDFQDEWRKHVNIYYNSLASGMGRSDSLGSEPVGFPGQFLHDVKYSPNQQYIATISQTSLERPVRRLYLTANDSTRETEILAEGAIRPGLSWNPQGTRLIYAKRTREKYGSLVNDLFLYNLDTRKETQITKNQRARYPVFGSDGENIAFIKNEGRTSNIYFRNLETGQEQKLTNHTENTQLIDLSWNHPRNELVFQRFETEGNRYLVTLNIETRQEKILDRGEATVDNRKPVISPDGSKIAYTSLRDDVPNIFIHDLETNNAQRLTFQFTGAQAYQWLAPTREYPVERLAIKASEEKDQEYLYLLDRDYTFGTHLLMVPQEYGSWRRQSPPNRIPGAISPDPSLVEDRYGYQSFRNLTHVFSFGLPYADFSGNYGLFGISSWTEPLGKHTIVAGGNISLDDITEDSYGVITYINNQLYPSLALSAYKIPGIGQFYGSDFLIEELTGGEIAASWPVDWFDQPYRNDRFMMRLRHVLVRPLETISFPGSDPVPVAQKARQTDIQFSWITQKQRPYVNNIIHPLDGYGVRLNLTASEKIMDSETAFVIPDLSAYKIFPGLGDQRLYLYGRFQAQFGEPLPQDYIGFSRYSNIDWPFPSGNLNIPYSKPERVRGYKSFVSGKQVAFGSLEYRMPVLPSLNTSILSGLLTLGESTLALFADAGVVWDVQIPAGQTTEKRLGTGVEIKNEIGLGPLNFVHSLGIAQPAGALFVDGDYDLYYQIKASVPF